MRQALRSIFGVILLCLAASHASAAGPTFPDRNRNAVVDAADAIPDDAQADLDARIVAWNRTTGHQLVVATVPSLQGYEIEDYGYQLLRHWGLGRTGINDGVILLLAPNERQVRIEVGYGLEPVLTDALSNEIIQQTIRPALRQSDVGAALTAGADRIMQAATANGEAAQPPREARRGFPWLKAVFIAIGLGLLILFLWPVMELWFYVWPFYLLFPERATRARQAHEAKAAKDAAEEKARKEKWKEEARAEHMALRKRYGRNYQRDPHWCPIERRMLSPGEAAERAAGRRREPSPSFAADSSSSYDSGWSSSSDSSSSYDSGFDSGGGSAGGGGADSSY